MKFSTDKYYFPPKPTLLPPKHFFIERYSNDENVIGELKLNGDHCLLYKVSESDYRFWTRHKSIFQYHPSDALITQLNNMAIPPKSIIDCELLHKKHRNFKHTLYFYDVQAWDGEYLIKVSLEERKAILKSLSYSTNIWNSLPFRGDFNELFEAIRTKEGHPFLELCKENYDPRIMDIVEGLVLKKLNSKSKLYPNSCKEVGWMYKIRLATKNYLF